jgi:hypothetical protein
MSFFDDFMCICFSLVHVFIRPFDGFCIQVYEFVGLTELYYAGSHGMDIMGPVKQSVTDYHQNCIKSTDKQV